METRHHLNAKFSCRLSNKCDWLSCALCHVITRPSYEQPFAPSRRTTDDNIISTAFLTTSHLAHLSPPSICEVSTWQQTPNTLQRRSGIPSRMRATTLKRHHRIKRSPATPTMAASWERLEAKKTTFLMTSNMGAPWRKRRCRFACSSFERCTRSCGFPARLLNASLLIRLQDGSDSCHHRS